MSKAEYRSAIRSRRMILASLADLLQEKPVDKITVTDVVRKAEINRGTFYAHYTDVPAVIDHLIQEIFSTIRDALSQQPKQLSDVPHVLLTSIQAILEKDLNFCRKIMTSKASTLMYEQLVAIVMDYLLQREEEFGFGDHELYVSAIRFCAGGLTNLYRDWFAGKLDCSLSELTQRGEYLLGIIIQSVTAPNGSQTSR